MVVCPNANKPGVCEAMQATYEKWLEKNALITTIKSATANLSTTTSSAMQTRQRLRRPFFLVM
jgi:hypothetical protein